MKQRIIILAVISALFTGGCLTNAASFGSSANDTALKDAYKGRFMTGAALNADQIYSDVPEPEMSLIKKHFNTVTPENILKWSQVHPAPGRYDFDPADKFVELAERNDMFAVGHTLVWHNQTPDWVFEDENGRLLNRDALLGRMKDHIFAVVGRYKGRIKGWDVVNEAVEDDGTLRKTKYLEIIGPDYIEKAFEYARLADPEAELYYNDYNMWKPEHRSGVVKLVRSLKDKGVRIDGIGMQGHWGLNYPDLNEAADSIVAYSALGVKVMITEFDISALPSAWDDRGADITKNYELNEKLNPYLAGLPPEMQRKLADRYEQFFTLFSTHSDKITRVTFWGVQDGDSWLNNWPVKGRTDYPFLFDRDCRPKPAFYSVINVTKKVSPEGASE